LPAAIVKSVLRSAGQIGNDGEVASLNLADGNLAGGASRLDGGRSEPDWSFQDIAVRRVIDSLSSARRAGLIVPTGGGKTRIALRIALTILARQKVGTVKVVWDTHRVNLRSQARRELLKMLSEGISDLPEDAARLLADRIEFIMLSELPARLTSEEHPALLIIDEGHHAAAASYQSAFETPYPLPTLFLTATPNRTDELPIGIDEIAYTITYKELAAEGCILLPKFEDMQVENFDWTDESVADLADLVISKAAGDYVKSLVLAPRIDRVEEFHAALLERLSIETNHPLTADDVGFVHSTSNSRGTSTEDFLAYFMQKPRGIIVSAQLLLEGFDDPAINAVVITYPSTSMIVLMQAAGRCVRYHPEKKGAYVLQARNDALAYHFDQRWLYQEISDYLRPQLTDIDYSDLATLRSLMTELLRRHNVNSAVQSRVLAELDTVKAGEHCRILLAGLPYYGPESEAEQHAPWTVVLETPESSPAFRSLFNNFCALGAGVSDPIAFLERYGGAHGIVREYSIESYWRRYMDMLTAMYFARKEIYEDGSRSSVGIGRGFTAHGPTTWLKYVTFNYRPAVSSVLGTFLEDCHNRDAIVEALLARPEIYRLCIKIPLPINGAEGYLLDVDQSDWFQAAVNDLRSKLQEVAPGDQFARLAAHVASLVPMNQPLSLLTRIDRFLPENEFAKLVHDLSNSGERS